MQDPSTLLPAFGGLDSPGTALHSHQKWGLWTHSGGLNVVAHAPRTCHRNSIRASHSTPYSQLPDGAALTPPVSPGGCSWCDLLDIPSGHYPNHDLPSGLGLELEEVGCLPQDTHFAPPPTTRGSVNNPIPLCIRPYSLKLPHSFPDSSFFIH